MNNGQSQSRNTAKSVRRARRRENMRNADSSPKRQDSTSSARAAQSKSSHPSRDFKMHGARSPGSIITTPSSASRIPSRNTSDASASSIQKSPLNATPTDPSISRLRPSTSSFASHGDNPTPNNTPSRHSSGPEVHVHRSSSDATDKSGGISLRPDTIVELGRTNSKRNYPTQIPVRQISRSSGSSIYPRNPPINSHGSIRTDGDIQSVHSAHSTDSSVSDISTQVSTEAPHTTLGNRLFGYSERSKTKKKPKKEEENKDLTKRERMKNDIIKNLKKTADVVKPMARDTLENTAQYGRMLSVLASYLAPAAMIGLWAYDALQLVETNQDTCQFLIDASIQQHQGLVEIIQKCRDMPGVITEHNESLIRNALEKHRDACNAVYDAVLAQKNQRYIMRFIRRKIMSEQDLANAKGALQEAMLDYQRVVMTMTWANTAETNRLMREQRQGTGRIYKMLTTIAAVLDENSAQSLIKRSLNQMGVEESERDRKVEEMLEERRRMATRRDEREYLETRLSDVRLAMADLMQLGNTPEEALAGLKRTRAEDQLRYQNLNSKKKKRRELRNDEQVELEILGKKLELYDKILSVLQQSTQPERAPGKDQATQVDMEEVEMMVPLKTRVKPRKEGRSEDGFDFEREEGQSRPTASAKLYEQRLVRHFPSTLKQPLWTPTHVEVGDVGYMDENTGEFHYLFSAFRARNRKELRSLEQFRFALKNDTDSIRTHAKTGALTRRTKVVVRKTESMRELRKSFKQPIKRQHDFGALESGLRALLVVDEPRYLRFSNRELNNVKAWFNKFIDAIYTVFRHRIPDQRKEKLILVTGVLSVKHWGLMLTKKPIKERIYFCEFDGPRKDTDWGAFSILGVPHGKEHIQGTDYETNVAPYHPHREEQKWDAVLISRLHFPVTNGRVEKRCVSD